MTRIERDAVNKTKSDLEVKLNASVLVVSENTHH